MSDQEVTPVFGIDLGTTYSCIAYVNGHGKAVIIPNSEGDRTTPSVVQFEEENRIVGKEAKNSAVLNPNQVVEMVKRHMGESNWRFGYNGTEYTAEEISSYILRKLGDDAEQSLGTPVKEVVITCPAYFGIAQRDATARAGEIAGFTVREVINEPTAAAIMYGLQNEQDQVVLVYDLGGGTFDITVIEIKAGAITVVATGGDHNLGGRSWDDAVVFYLAEQWKIEAGSSDDPVDSEESLQELWLKAEQAKQALTVRQETKVTVTHAGQRIGVTLTREKFNELTANLLERTIDFTKTTMDEARARGFTRFDQILLVGGSTKMPQVAERLAKEFHLPLKVFDPDEAVAKGAALYGYQMFRYGEKNQTKPAVFSTKAVVKDTVVRKSTFLVSEPPQINSVFTKMWSRPNFYILLGLNLSEPWDQSKFELALRNKRIEWSRQGAGISKKALAAKQNLALIPEIQRVMQDAALREAEAKAAEEELSSGRKAKFESFERELRFLNAKEYLEQDELDTFKKEFGTILSDEEITARVKVPVKKSTPSATPATAPQLDPTIAREIDENLALLGIADLYALLERPDTTSNTEMYRAAEQLYNEMVSRQPKTAEVTAKSTLAGHARTIFKSQEERKRYDETLRQRTLNVLLKDIERSVNRTLEKEVHEKQVLVYLEMARKAGWDKETATAKLKEYARTRKWLLQLPSSNNQIRGPRCEYCNKINEQGNTLCIRCNKELMITCSNCGYLVAIDDMECSACRFSVGNRYWVDILLERCRSSIQAHDLRSAQDDLNEAEELWQPQRPDMRIRKIKELRADLQKIGWETHQNNISIYGSVQGFIQGDNNTITLHFQNQNNRIVPFLAPLLSNELTGRDELIYKLKQQLLNGGNLALSALNGLPGVGKTALALALARDPEILTRFYDGVLWAGLGRESNVLSHLNAWAIALDTSIPETEQLLMQAIHRAIGMRRMLLIIDDAWSVEAALKFKLGGPNCAHLMTTRLPEVAGYFASNGTIVVRELDETNSLTLLEHLTPGIRDTAPKEARELVHAVGGLPLPLTLMGNYLRIQMQTGQPRRLRSALDRLQQIEERLRLGQPLAGLERHPDLPEGVPLSLLAVIKISDEALDERTRQVLRALSVFPSKPNTFLEDAALAVANASTESIDILADFGLLESGGPERYTLHQTISDYAKSQLTDVTVYNRMVEFFIKYIENYKKDNQKLERETNNILAAVEVILEQGMQTTGAEAFAYFIRILRRTRIY